MLFSIFDSSVFATALSLFEQKWNAQGEAAAVNR